HYDRGLTPFIDNYLGAATITDDNGDYTSVNGVGSVFGGLGPYGLSYPFTDYSDRITADGSAELAFQGNNGFGASVDKDNGTYRTTFWTFPWEAINNATNRQNVLEVVLDWCNPNQAVLAYSPSTVEVTVDLGDTVTSTLTVSNTGTVSFTFVTSESQPWVSVSPSGGTVAPGGSLDLDVVFDAAAVGGPGDYSTNLTFSGDYDNPVDPATLLMHVVEPPGVDLYLPVIFNNYTPAAGPSSGALPSLLPLGGLILLPAVGLVLLPFWRKRR
ncbi:MAG: hypothetical protein L0322_20590, partial [Chloroflexi bacterium]|nr:hypothetical protein [Chloroflexota bacterium]